MPGGVAVLLPAPAGGCRRRPPVSARRGETSASCRIRLCSSFFDASRLTPPVEQSTSRLGRFGRAVGHRSEPVDSVREDERRWPRLTLHWRAERGRLVLHLRGEVDVDAGAALGRVRDAAELERAVIVDLSEVSLATRFTRLGARPTSGAPGPRTRMDARGMKASKASLRRGLRAVGARSQRPFSRPPSSAAKQASLSNRGAHNQSIEPFRRTSAAAWVSPISA